MQKTKSGESHKILVDLPLTVFEQLEAIRENHPSQCELSTTAFVRSIIKEFVRNQFAGEKAPQLEKYLKAQRKKTSI